MESLAAIDQGVLYFFQSLHRDGLNELGVFTTKLGNTEVLGILSAIITLLFVLLRRPRFAIGFALVCLISVTLNYGVKIAVGRPRPSLATALVKVPNNPSFPSGHALCSMAIYTTAFTLLGSLIGRRWLGLVGVLLGLAIGLSRPFVGVHYPSDVLAGWIAGLGVALVALPWILLPPVVPEAVPVPISPKSDRPSNYST